MSHHLPFSEAFRHYFGAHLLRHVKAPVSSILGLFRFEPETVTETPLGLPEYTEALWEGWLLSGIAPLGRITKTPVKSMNTVAIYSCI